MRGEAVFAAASAVAAAMMSSQQTNDTHGDAKSRETIACSSSSTSPTANSVLPLESTQSSSSSNPLLLDGIFDEKDLTQHVDYSDNKAQIEVIKRHYQNEFRPQDSHSLEELLKDYREDAVIHEVLDNEPRTYRGKHGVQRACQDMYNILHLSRTAAAATTTTTSDNNNGADSKPLVVSKVELEHIAVNHNHAQVIWKAKLVPSGCDNKVSHWGSRRRRGNDDNCLVARQHCKTIYGTDSFTFDKDNHITTQTIVALSLSAADEEEL